MILIDSFKFAAAGGGSVTVVQATSSYTGGSPQSKAFASNVTAGNLIVVFVQDGDNSGLIVGDPTVTDNLGNTYTKAIGNISISRENAWIYYAKNISGGACTVTVTKGTNGVDPGFHQMEVSGCSTSAPLISTTSGTGTGTALSATDLVISQSSGIIVAGGGNESISGSHTAGSGYTIDNQQTGHPSAMEHQIISASGTYPVTMTGPNATDGWALVAAFFN